jgi:enoyl-[acyl-carrier protein] reductase III
MNPSAENPFSVSGKVILVTGGTRGLGRAISLQLARSGAKVIAGYFQNEIAAESFRQEVLGAGLGCETVKANLMTATGVQCLADFVASRFPHLDALIYNSATGVHKPLLQQSQRHLLGVWQVNVGAFFDLSLKVKPLMRVGSRIVAISSEGARRAVNDYGSVGSSKAALEALCRQMAAEWIVDGISVNIVAPGLLETDTLKVWENAGERIQHETKASPLGRLVRLSEVSHLIHFLCSDGSDGIVGQTLNMDGGKSISSIQ